MSSNQERAGRRGSGFVRKICRLVITLVLTAWLGGCLNSPSEVPRFIHHDTGMRPQDVRIRTDQVARVRVIAGEGETAVLILFSNLNTEHGVFFTLDRIKLKAGYRVDDYHNRDKNFTVTAYWDGLHYMESTRLPTYVHFVVQSMSPQEAVIEASARLIAPPTGHFINLPLTLLRVQGADLATLRGAQRGVTGSMDDEPTMRSGTWMVPTRLNIPSKH